MFHKKAVRLRVSLIAMTRAERIANLIGVVVPFLGLIAAVVLLWNQWVDWIDLTIMAVLYLLYGMGITVGYHRLLTHRAFQTHKPVQYAFAVLGSMGAAGRRARLGRRPPQAPRPHRPGGRPALPARRPREGLKGLWHAHAGWLFETHGQADWKKYARELYEDQSMKRITGCSRGWRCEPRHPALLGWALHGFTARGRAARPDLGRPGARVLPAPRHVVDQLGLPLLRPPPVRDRGPSTNVAWLALPSLGEAWHHNHHAFPRSAAHGLRPVGGRRLEPRSSPDAADRPGVERRADHAGAPAGQAGRTARAGARRLTRLPGSDRLALQALRRELAHDGRGRTCAAAVRAARRGGACTARHGRCGCGESGRVSSAVGMALAWLACYGGRPAVRRIPV